MGELIVLPSARRRALERTNANRPGEILAFRQRLRTVHVMDSPHHPESVQLRCCDSKGEPTDFAAIVAAVFDGTADPADYTVTIGSAEDGAPGG